MACRSLRNITKNSCESNQGGLYTTVWVMNRSKLTITPNDTEDAENEGTVTLAWKQGFSGATDATTLKFRKQSSGLTSEGTVDDPNGINFITSNLALVFARQNLNKRIAVQALALQEDLAVIVRDANGENHFLGVDNSVTATAFGATTGTASTDANNYTITLTDISNELPYMVTNTTMATLFGEDWQTADLPTA